MISQDTTQYTLIGSRIREVRIRKKMTQAELAEKAHLSLPHISEIELGKTKMILGTFINIAEALQVSTDTLLRANVPEVNGIYQNEFADILADCTPKEIEAILKIVFELKSTMRLGDTQ